MFNKIAPHLRRGQQGERLAERFLVSKGLTIVAKNVRSRYGEIDLIALEANVLLFIEVRLRQQHALVSAVESITPRKQRKWHLSAQDYLQRHYNRLPDCRFDAICVTEQSNSPAHKIEWIKGVM